MKVVEAKNVQSKANPHGVDARSLSDADNAQVSHITLQPGQSLKMHITPADVVFYVLQGRGIVEIVDEQHDVGPDVLIESLARISHRWTNQSKDILRFLVIKAPRPKESTKIL
jgi:mannose-6-phosphate isomerase-like protein (cupin superfamily)